jgi:hypothetical protein
MFTVRSTDTAYNSPLIGNGEIVTTVGPTGYHNGLCPAEETLNRTIFWAGRRLRDARDVTTAIPRVPPEEMIGPTRPLVRFGRLTRTLTVDGAGTADDDWEQTLDCDHGVVISTLNHGPIREETRSLVCLTANVLVFHTRLENRGERPAHPTFALSYEFGDAEGHRTPDTRLHIRRPHPDDLPFGNVEGLRSKDTDRETRPPHLLESLSVQYEVNEQLGEVHIGRCPLGEIRETEGGGRFTHQLELGAGEATDLWFWVALSDRLKYTHFPAFEQVSALLAAHERAWSDFWGTSHVEFGSPALEAIYQASLYTMRCNASPWYVPPGYLSTIWEGRTLHDEFYPFMGLLSGNYRDLAERMPNYRLLTLPVAEQRGAGWGAYYAWEATEDGEESAPYGHWTDEQFRHGVFSEEAWRTYLYTGDRDALARYYPVMRGCAEWLIYDVLTRDESGRLGTRFITDMNEVVYPVENSVFVACATIRALENGARAAELLGVDAARRGKWRRLATELRHRLPVDETGQRYRYAGNTDAPLGTSHVAMIFPFSFDVHDERAREALNQIYDSLGKGQLRLHWIWTVGRLATAFFYQGRADEGYEMLCRAPASVGPFMAPNEHLREEGGAYLPWLTTGAGAFVHAVHAMFVQVVDETPPILLHALPSAVRDARFEQLLASQGVAVSGRVADGKLVSLTAQSDRAMAWSFRIPRRLAATAPFAADVTVSEPDALGLATVGCTLTEGSRRIV